MLLTVEVKDNGIIEFVGLELDSGSDFQSVPLSSSNTFEITPSSKGLLAFRAQAQDQNGNITVIDRFVRIYNVFPPPPGNGNLPGRNPEVVDLTDGTGQDDDVSDQNQELSLSFDGTLFIRFSEPIDRNTVTEDSLQLVDPEGVSVNISFDFQDGDTRVCATPVRYLRFGATYTLELREQIKDLDGESFVGTTRILKTNPLEQVATIEWKDNARTIPLKNVEDVAMLGDILVVIDHPDGFSPADRGGIHTFQVWDETGLNLLTEPKHIGSAVSFGRPLSLAVSGDRAFVANRYLGEIATQKPQYFTFRPSNAGLIDVPHKVISCSSSSTGSPLGGIGSLGGLGSLGGFGGPEICTALFFIPDKLPSPESNLAVHDLSDPSNPKFIWAEEINFLGLPGAHQIWNPNTWPTRVEVTPQGVAVLNHLGNIELFSNSDDPKSLFNIGRVHRFGVDSPPFLDTKGAIKLDPLPEFRDAAYFDSFAVVVERERVHVLSTLPGNSLLSREKVNTHTFLPFQLSRIGAVPSYRWNNGIGNSPFTDLAFLPTPDQGLEIYDMNEPKIPKHIGRLPDSVPGNLSFDTNLRLAYLHGPDNAFHVIDFTNPRKPRELNDPGPNIEPFRVEGPGSSTTLNGNTNRNGAVFLAKGSGVAVIKVKPYIAPDLIAHRTGLKFGTPIMEEVENRHVPADFVVLTNNDREQGLDDFKKDFEDNIAVIPNGEGRLADDQDDDLVKITLRKLNPRPQNGVLKVLLDGAPSSDKVRLFDENGSELADSDLMFDLENLNGGYLTGILFQSVTIWLEGVETDPDFEFALVLEDSQGNEVSRDEIHMLIAEYTLRGRNSEEIDFVTSVPKQDIIDARINGNSSIVFPDEAFFKNQIEGLPTILGPVIEVISDSISDGYVDTFNPNPSFTESMLFGCIYEASPTDIISDSEKRIIKDPNNPALAEPVNIVHGQGAVAQVTTAKDMFAKRIPILRVKFIDDEPNYALKYDHLHPESDNFFLRQDNDHADLNIYYQIMPKEVPVTSVKINIFKGVSDTALLSIPGESTTAGSGLFKTGKNLHRCWTAPLDLGEGDPGFYRLQLEVKIAGIVGSMKTSVEDADGNPNNGWQCPQDGLAIHDLIWKHRPRIHMGPLFNVVGYPKHPLEIKNFLKLSIESMSFVDVPEFPVNPLTFIPLATLFKKENGVNMPISEPATLHDLRKPENNTTNHFLDIRGDMKRSLSNSGPPPVPEFMYTSNQSSAPGYVFLQYWFFYFYSNNPFKSLHHEGDVEYLQVAIKISDLRFPKMKRFWLNPFSATASQHYYGQTLEWDIDNGSCPEDPHEQRRIEHQHGRPCIYIAIGTHAMYFAHGEFLTTDKKFPNLFPISPLFAIIGTVAEPPYLGTQIQYKHPIVGFISENTGNILRENIKLVEMPDVFRNWSGSWGYRDRDPVDDRGEFDPLVQTGPPGPINRSAREKNGTKVNLLRDPKEFHNRSIRTVDTHLKIP